MVTPSASVIFVFLEPEARILEGLRDVLPMENPLLLRMSQQRRERDQGYRKVEQEGVRRRSGCAWTTKHKLHHTHVSLVLPFEEPMICAGNAVRCTILATVRVPFAATQHTTVNSQNSAS